MNPFLIKLKNLLQSNIFYFFLLIFIICFILINYFLVPNKSTINSEENIKGTITNIKIKDDKVHLTLKINRKENLIVYLKDYGNFNFQLGMKLNVSGKLNIPSKNTIFNCFNYQKYLYHHHIFYTLTDSKFEVINDEINFIYKIKNYIIKRSNNSKNKGYLKAFIIGDKNELESYKTYTKNGVSHLFALSGMHISLLSGILLFLLKKNSKANLIVILFLIVYSFITNYSASLNRSIVFFILLKINKKLDLNISTLKVLYLTMFFLILSNYLIIFDIGFIYSCSVSFGLIYSRKFYKNNYIYNLFVTSIMAFLFSLPITLSNNYEINLLSIVSNLIIVPLVSVIIYPLSLLVFIFPFLDVILTIFISILEFINNLLSFIHLNLIICKIPIYLYLIYYTFLILFINTNKTKYLLFNILFIAILKIIPLFSHTLYVDYLDVGQGDSALLSFKNKAVLIDTGGQRNYNVSNNTMVFLKSKGISKLSYLVLTHGDFDHMGDAINLINNFKVEKVIFNCGEFNDLEKELIKVLNKKHIKYYSCIKELNIDNNKLYFLQTKEYDNENDNSNVIYTELNGYKFMFMGDAGVEKEKDILNKYNISGIDVLKVGHHGSKTSSSKEFINEINPNYSIISVGKNNRYGHPNKEVLNNLSDSKIYRTDQDGSVMFKIKNNKLKIETCSP